MTAAVCGLDVSPPRPLRFWDDRIHAGSVAVMAGEVYVTDGEEHIPTVLGSCVSACVRHPGTGTGGMNHLMLAEAHPKRAGDGLASLDLLLDRVLRSGGRLDELEVKLFGGGRVIAAASDIGALNVAAVRDYFAGRGLAIAVADVGGAVARRLRYVPRSGRAWIQRMAMRATQEPRRW